MPFIPSSPAERRPNDPLESLELLHLPSLFERSARYGMSRATVSAPLPMNAALGDLGSVSGCCTVDESASGCGGTGSGRLSRRGRLRQIELAILLELGKLAPRRSAVFAQEKVG